MSRGLLKKEQQTSNLMTVGVLRQLQTWQGREGRTREQGGIRATKQVQIVSNSLHAYNNNKKKNWKRSGSQNISHPNKERDDTHVAWISNQLLIPLSQTSESLRSERPSRKDWQINHDISSAQNIFSKNKFIMMSPCHPPKSWLRHKHASYKMLNINHTVYSNKKKNQAHSRASINNLS